jgi:large subunit ribosomal protein L30
MAGKLKITQVRSTSGHIKKQREVIRALGIKRLYQSVEQMDSPQIRGMIEKVRHLVKVEVENSTAGGEV